LKKPKTKPALTREQVYALRSHTVKIKDGKFYTAPTIDQSTFSGPYKSLQACCQAISRKLGEEFTKRKQRTEAFYGKRR
jgi:hypothetical protein